jgi:cytochrome c oxidase subunit 2
MIARLTAMARGASSLAGGIDLLIMAMGLLCLVVSIGVWICMITFVVRYHKGSKASRAQRKAKSMPVELTWTLVPFALFLAAFVWSIRLYARIETPPSDATPIYVVARQWMWKLQHVNGVREINELHVPVGRDIKLVMISQDVIHSFFVPAFRIKQDVLPGRYTQLWFRATQAGTYNLFCAEYCGTLHADMGGKIVVMKPAAFAAWLDSRPHQDSMVERGKKLFRKYGCSGCHIDGSSVHAPRLQDLYGKPVPLTGGSFVKADEAYFHDSVMQPDKQIAAGYAPIMPSFDGQMPEDDLMALTEWFRAGAPQ